MKGLSRPGWAVLGLSAAGLALRAWGVRPTLAYIPDVQIVREALQLGVWLSGSDFGAVTGFKYPLILPYVLGAGYGLVYAGGRLLGVFASLAAFQAYLFRDVALFHLIAVGLVAALNTLTIPVVYLLGREVYGPGRGLAGAALFATGLLGVHFAHQARPHGAVTFALALAFLACLPVLRGGGRRAYVLAGLSAGLAAGILHNGVFAFGFLLAAHALGQRPRGRGLPALALDGRLWLGLLAGGVVVLAAYPFLLIDPRQVVRIDPGGVLYLSGVHDVDAASWDAGRMWDRFLILLNYEPAATGLGLAGLVYGFFAGRERRAHGIASAFVAAYFLLFAPLDYTEARFFTPLPPFLGLMAGNLVLGAAERLAARPAPSGRAVTAICFVLAAPGAALSARLDWLMARPDTRTEAIAWIEQNIPAGTPLALETDLPLPASRVSLERQEAEYPGSLGAKDRWQLAQPAGQEPQASYALVRLWVYQPGTPEQFSDLFEPSARPVLLLTSRAPGRADWLYSLAASRGEVLRQFSPQSAGAPLADWALPLDLSRPLRDLWAVDRPGPLVEVVQMNGSGGG